MRRRDWPVLAVVALLLGACASATDVAEDTPESATKANRSTAGPGDRTEGGDGSGDDGGEGERLRLPNLVGPKPVFLTPSRNIGCAISTDEVRCDIIERSYPLPDKPADCQGDFGHSIAVGRQGIARFICVTDTVVDRAAPVLEYGTSTEVGDFGCTSTEENISCYYLLSDHGFELSRESPALF